MCAWLFPRRVWATELELAFEEGDAQPFKKSALMKRAVKMYIPILLQMFS
jgi:hypothetical protein